MTEAPISFTIDQEADGWWINLEEHDRKAGPYPDQEAAEQAISAFVEATLCALIEGALTGETS